MRKYLIAGALLLILPRSVLAQSTEDFLASGSKKFDRKDYQGAVDDFTSALEYDPFNADLYFQRGSARAALQDCKGWFDDAQRAISANADKAEYFFMRAQANGCLNDYAGEIADSARALEMMPGNTTYKVYGDKVKARLAPLLLAAVAEGNQKQAEKLLSAGANPNLRDSSNNTLLVVAVLKEDLPLVTMLVEAKADVNARGADGATPLQLAVNKKDVFEKLVECLLSHGADSNSLDAKGNTPLHTAVLREDLATVQLLVTSKANINAKDRDGATPLQKALVKLQDSPRQLVNYLIDHGADVHVRDTNGNTLLHLFEEQRFSSFVSLFIEKGVNPDLKNKAGQIAFSSLTVDGREQLTHPKAYELYGSALKKGVAKDYKGALAEYDQAIALSPAYADYYLSRSYAKMSLGDAPGMLADAEKATTLEPAKVENYEARGLAKNNCGDYKGALADLKKALSMANDRWRAAKNYTIALDNLERQAHPDAYALYQKGIQKNIAGEYQGAIQEYSRAIAISPDFPGYYHERGKAKSWLDDWRGMLNDLDKALSLNRYDAAAYLSRGKARGALGDRSGHMNDFIKAVEYDQENQDFITARNSLNAKLLAEQEEWRKEQAVAASAPQQQGRQRHSQGDDATNCAWFLSGYITNACDQTIQARISGNRYCTSGTYTIGPKQQAHVACVDTSNMYVERATFTGN